MPFDKESDFEEALAAELCKHGWSPEILMRPTEADLVRNWRDILFDNNRGIDRLNEAPLTDGEMGQILDQVRTLKTPLKLNAFINGGSVAILRDNPADPERLGREVSLKIYDRQEIAAGQSRYQIARQPIFAAGSKILNDRRGDMMLLINGMPVFHLELKKTGIPVSQACRQIEKYAHEGVFTGLFALVQIFVAMNPEETLYFANPGPEGSFNPDFYFHWADVDNEPVNDWRRVVAELLFIPMAHQLIGFYTVADSGDGALKVMRSYQYNAANAISDKVAKIRGHWGEVGQRGGYVWHTTGSGKTMTAFKAAQLIAASKDADKVVFLMDRIELGTQSLKEFRNFADDGDEVQGTANTGALAAKLKSDNPAHTLIVTSIQKMSNIKDEAEGGMKAADLAQMQSKRIVFIVDECHRNVFGEMLYTIKQTFPRAVFFGFTGTPIHDENRKKDSTTTTVFGDELHRYSIADGIRDGNVLGFDPHKALTYRDSDLRQAVALEQAKAATVKEALADPKRKKVYYRFMNLPMAGKEDDAGRYVKGIEDYLPASQYDRDEHRTMVVQDIAEHWPTLSRDGTFHAILATASILEAIAYYRMFVKDAPQLKVAALFDPNIDNTGGAIPKEEGLVEIIGDYNRRYGQNFSIPAFAAMKRDIAARLAHKSPYEYIAREPEQQIDLLIVVDQMLTGYDSKWVNTLYLDKSLEYENIIQAFSRTNRLFGPEKPFGVIKYYRRPHTMEKNIEKAVKLYSGDKPLGLFVDHLDAHLKRMNALFEQIADIFTQAGIKDFERLPPELGDRVKFVQLFNELNKALEAAKIQGFTWEQSLYSFAEGEQRRKIACVFDKRTYDALVARYKELSRPGGGGGEGEDDTPFDIKGYITTIETADIDADYMNGRFVKFLKLLRQDDATEEAMQLAVEALHRSFAALSQEEQKIANILLHDIQRGNFIPEEGKPLRDYITEEQTKAQKRRIDAVAAALGVDGALLAEFLNTAVTEQNLNEFGRFDKLLATVDIPRAKAWFEQRENTRLIPPKARIKAANYLRAFILGGGVSKSGEDAEG